MRKWLAAIGAAATIALLTGTACADTVKVGVISTFSGGFARWGEQFKQAIEVYQAQHGKTVNGHTIEIVYRDDGGPDPAKARQLAEELILREKVQFVAGFPWSPNALAVAELVTEAKMPTVIFNAATSVITRRSPYFVRTSFTLAQDTVPIARWAAKNGIKTVVIAVADYAPGHDAESFFITGLQGRGRRDSREHPHSARHHRLLAVLRAHPAEEAGRDLHVRARRPRLGRHDQHLGSRA